MVDLNTLIDPLSGWVLSDAADINDAGQITGQGLIGGQYHAYLLTPVQIPGDFNNNGTVDAADYVVWRKGIGVAPTQDNYNLWRAHFGQTVRQRLGCQCECRCSRTSNAFAADVGRGWLVSAARPRRIESSNNSLPRETPHQPTLFESRSAGDSVFDATSPRAASGDDRDAYIMTASRQALGAPDERK